MIGPLGHNLSSIRIILFLRFVRGVGDSVGEVENKNDWHDDGSCCISDIFIILDGQTFNVP